MQFVELHRAAGTLRGTVALVHGGFWRWSPDYLNGPTPAAQLLATMGWNIWQIEYRSVGSWGGWPTTLEDVAGAIDRLANVPDIKLGRVITFGRSPGGHLAVWALGHTGPVTLVGEISLAGLLDLRLAEREGICNDAAVNFLGGTSADFPDRYDSASPSEQASQGAVERPPLCPSSRINVWTSFHDDGRSEPFEAQVANRLDSIHSMVCFTTKPCAGPLTKSDRSRFAYQNTRARVDLVAFPGQK